MDFESELKKTCDEYCKMSDSNKLTAIGTNLFTIAYLLKGVLAELKGLREENNNNLVSIESSLGDVQNAVRYS